MKGEEWRAIPGFLGRYEVSSHGRVRSLGRWVEFKDGRKPRYWPPKIKKQVMVGAPGYEYRAVLLSKRAKIYTRPVHRLVMLAFVGPRPVGLITRHLDGNKYNNRRSNLVYGTPQENADDRRRHGTQTYGEGHSRAKLTEREVRKIKRLYATGRHYAKYIAVAFGVSDTTVRDILHKRTWSHIV